MRNDCNESVKMTSFLGWVVKEVYVCCVLHMCILIVPEAFLHLWVGLPRYFDCFIIAGENEVEVEIYAAVSFVGSLGFMRKWWQRKALDAFFCFFYWKLLHQGSVTASNHKFSDPWASSIIFSIFQGVIQLTCVTSITPNSINQFLPIRKSF